MDVRLMKHLVTHISCFVRQYISEDNTYVSTLDRNSSINRYAWLNSCRKGKFEIIQLPSNISHFLQLCDRKMNKQIKNAVSSFRDKLGKLQYLSLNSVRTKLILAVIG